MWYSSVMPQCSNQRTSERAQFLSAMTHPSTVLDLDAKQSFVTPKSYIYIYRFVELDYLDEDIYCYSEFHAPPGAIIKQLPKLTDTKDDVQNLKIQNNAY